MPVNEVLTSADLRTAACKDHLPLLDAARKIAEIDVNALAVTDDNGTLRGIITDHDIIRGLVRNDGRADGLSVADCMTRRVITIEIDSPLSSALRLMGRHRIRHLVVTRDGVLAGVVGIKDLMIKIHEDDALEAKVLRDLAMASKAAVA